MTDWRSNIDAALEQTLDEQRQQQQQAGLLASGRNPDEYARAGQLADRHGVSQDLVATNLPEFERQDRNAAFDTLSAQHPELQSLTANPRWRTLADDDAEGVGRLATALKSRPGRQRTLLSRSFESLFGPLLGGERGQAFLQNLDDVSETMSASTRGVIAALGEASSEASRNINEGDSVATARAIALGTVDPRKSERLAAAARFEIERERRAKEAAGARDEAGQIQGSYGDGSPGYYAMGVALSVPVMAAAAATRSPMVGGLLIGGTTAAEQRSSAQADGATPGQATASGVVQGTIEATFDTLTLGIAKYGLGPVREMLVKRYGSNVATQLLTRATASAPGRLVTATASGVATEIPTTVAQMASDEAILGTDYSGADYWRGIRDSAVQGGAMSGGLYAATAPLRALADADLQRGLSAADNLAYLQAITTAAAESKLGQRSAEDAAAIAQAVAADERVYLGADDAKVLFQDDPGLLAELVGGDDALTEQLASGDISIPIANWVRTVARLPNADEIVRHARMDPDGLSAVEIERMDAEFAAFVGDTADAAARAEPAGPDPRQQIIDDVSGQLVSTGRFTPAQAEAQAKLWGAAFSIFGKNSGQDAFALYQRYMAGISAGTTSPEPRRLQPRAGREGADGADQGQAPVVERGLFTRAVDAVRSLFQLAPIDQTKTPEFKRWFGDSKVVDANGEPLIVYHGTDSTPFEVFDRAKGGSGPSKFGFWFTNQETFAELFGGNMMPVYLKAENPKRITLEKWNQIRDKHAKDGEWFSRWRDDLIAQGHDGLMVAGGTDQVGKFTVQNPDVLAVFDPTQIKSATANSGAFDPNSPSILKQQQADKGPRGQINIFPDRRMSIQLFENADRSTFIHESAHFFFEVLRDLATADGASPEIAADFDAALKFMGYESKEQLTEDSKKVAAITKKAEAERRELTPAEKAEISRLNEPLEKIARAFEAYIGEGKAPSPELRSVFAKLAAWILGVYRSLKALNVELTPEVRGVFDRMLASDDEIAVAQARQSMAPLALDAKEGAAIGLTEKQFADYMAMTEAAAEEARQTVRQQTLSALERERAAWWKEERAAVQREVSDRYEATTAVRALRILSGRRVVDGVELAPPLAGLKLDKAAIVAGWGDAYLKRLGKTYAKSGGVHPDEAAMLLGYASGDDLLVALANAPDTIARVKSEADAIMRDRHGDPMTDGTLAEKAMDAVHGSKRVQLLERELEILGKLAGQPTPNRRMLKAMAERQIAAKTPRQLRPNDYLVAERRAAREAIKASARGDYADALLAKRRQAVNVSLYSAARAAQEQFDTDLRYLQRMTTSERRARLGKAGHDYLEQVDGLLEAIELRPASGPEVNRRARLVEWVHAQEKAGNPVNVPVKLLAEAGMMNLRDMAHADIRGVVDTIKQIEHLAKTKTRLFLAGQERDRDEVDAEMAGSVLAAHEKQAERTGDPTFGEKVRSKITDLDIGRLLPTNVARELDGYEDGGAVWRHVILPIREAMYQRVIPATRKMQEAVAELYAKHYSDEALRRLNAPVWREAVGDHWSKGRILSLAMNWGSDGNREAILSQARSKISEEQAVALLRTLDANDWAFVQGMIDQINSYWVEIAETQRRRTGLVPEKVEAKPFTITNDTGEEITVRGGYFPLKYDSEHSGFGMTLNEMEDAYNDLRVGRTAKAATKNGHTIERVGSGGNTVALDLDIATSHMRSVIRDLHLGDAVNYVHNVLHGSDFANAVVSVGKRQHLTALELWLKDVATGEIGPQNAVENVIRFVRQNTTAAVLTYKASSALLQVSGLVQTGSVIGNAAMLRGVKRLLSKSWIGPNSVWNDIREKSPYMRERFGNVVDAVEQVESAKDGRIKSLHSGMIRWGYVPMARVQMIADAATWLAGEAVGLKKFDGDADKARAFADDLVIRAQSPDSFIDKSSIGRGTLDTKIRQSEAIKTTTMLLSYMIAKGNIAREKYQATSVTNPLQVARFTADMIQLFAFEAILMSFVRNGLPDDEDDDGFGDDWFKYLAKEIGLGSLATIPLVSQLATEGRGFTAQGVMDRAWAQVEGATDRWFDDEINRKDLKALVTVSGVMAGVPSSQINTTADALWRVHDGEDVSPIDFIVKPEKPRE